MARTDSGLQQFHWLIEILQTVDVGIVVMDLDFKIQAWNAFMENNSGIDSADALENSLFEVFPDLPADWFKQKAQTAMKLRSRAFTVWEQRPFVFKFRNNRPITGVSEFMYQNCTIFPITATDGAIEQLAVIVYDVSDVANCQLSQKSAKAQQR